jgi:mannosyl-oligosaccharide alpha-1,3-glucosidase
MIMLIGFLGFILCKLALAVDRNAFKSCTQSGFCNRNRNIAEHILNEESIVPWSVQKVFVNGPNLDLKIGRLGEQLDVTIQCLKNGALKVNLNPITSSSRRYKIPNGDVIVDDLVSSTNFFKSDDDESNVYRIIGTGLRVIVTTESFSISLNSETDGEILKLNSRNLLNFENGYSFKLFEIVGGIDEKTNNELWKEPKFSSRNQDTRTNGPNSIGVDISFCNSKAIYGIPEHATNLALKSTRGFDKNSKKVFSSSDPYRLFNLDVFEYELDSTMALYGTVPIMLGHNPQGSDHRSVGVFWNNPSETWVDIYNEKEGDGKLTHWMSESGSFNMYIFAGKDLKHLQKTIKTLTGAPQLPPSFALGYHQCRWNYKSVEDVLEVHENFDKNSLPVDVIWLDIEHTDGKKYMSWHPTNFADPEQMISELSRAGRKLVTIVDPHLKKEDDWEIYRELVDKKLAVKANDRKSDFEGDCWPGKSVWTDYTNPEARKWWASLFSLDKYKVLYFR